VPLLFLAKQSRHAQIRWARHLLHFFVLPMSRRCPPWATVPAFATKTPDAINVFLVEAYMQSHYDMRTVLPVTLFLVGFPFFCGAGLFVASQEPNRTGFIGTQCGDRRFYLPHTGACERSPRLECPNLGARTC